MSKKLQIHIPEPCHENWQNMTATEKGKFCGTCQKEVIDFSIMSDSELISFFKKPATSVCGRFQNDQLQRDMIIPRKPVPFLKYFFQFTLPAFLLSLKASAQAERTVGKIHVSSEVKPEKEDLGCGEPVANEKRLAGQVVDGDSLPVPFATVMVRGTRTGVACDSEGKFALLYDSLPLELEISSVGYEPYNVLVRDEKPVVIKIENRHEMLAGEVVVTMGLVIRTPKKEKVPLLQRLFSTTTSKEIKVFPNPVAIGKTISIQLNKTEEGEAQVQIMDMQGQLVHTKEVVLASKSETFSLALPMITPGQYLVNVTMKKTGKTYSEKLVVQ